MVGIKDSVTTTKIKALLLPKPLDEMRDQGINSDMLTRLLQAAGLKITSPDLEGVCFMEVHSMLSKIHR